MKNYRKSWSRIDEKITV